MSIQLAEKIRTQYGEVPRLKSSFSATALGMFSNGWVWFVTDTTGELGILPTFGPSTLLIRSRENMNYIKGVIGEKNVEDPTPSSLPQTPYSPFSKTPPPSNPTTPPQNRSIHSMSTDALLKYVNSVAEVDTTADRLQTVGDVIYPLFCVPVYEHAWMSAGFGVWGKEDWLKEFWPVLDWRKVSMAYDYALKKMVPL
jgi:Fe-Mn family superoxide dismutase